MKSGRIDGGMEAIAAVLTDACLADCIKELGDNSDNPSTDELKAVLPGIVERHGVASTRHHARRHRRRRGAGLGDHP